MSRCFLNQLQVATCCLTFVLSLMERGVLLAAAQLPGGALQVKGAVRDPRARHLAQFHHQETNSKCLQLEGRCPFRLSCWFSRRLSLASIAPFP